MRFLKNAGLALGGVLLGLALVETLARICLPQPTQQINLLRRRSPDWQFDFSKGRDRGGYQPFLQRCPNSPCICDGANPETMNNYGFRDRDFPLAKPGTGVRIAVVGDSFTEGWCVPRDAAFPRILEKSLAPRVEVLNFGLSCRSPVRYAWLYDSIVRQFRPDFLLVALFANDAEEDHDLTPFVELDSRGVPTTFDFEAYFRNTPRLPRTKLEKRLDRLQWNLCKYSRIFPYVAVYGLESSYRKRHLYAASDEEYRRYWKISEAHLQALVRLSRTDRVKILVAYIPCQGDYRTPYVLLDLLRRFCEQVQAPLFVPARFIQAEAAQSLYIPNEGHFTVEGHRLYGEELAGWFKTQLP